MAKKAFSVKSIGGIRHKADYKEQVDKARGAVFTILFFSFLIFVAIAAIAIYSEGVGQFVATLESVNPYYFGVALLIILISYAMRYPKWSMYLHRLGVRLPFSKNFPIYMSMYSMDITPGRWGRAIVSFTINKLSKVSFARTFPAVVADIFTDFLGFAVITDVSAIIVNRFVVLSIALTILLMIPFFFVYVQRPFDFVKEKIRKYRSRITVLKRLDIVLYTATLYFKHNRKLGLRSFAYSMFLTIPSMFLNGMALYFVIVAFGIPLGISNIAVIMFIFSSSLVLGMVTGIPGTLGVTDAALISQLQLFFPGTITLGLASAITIVFRIASVWFVQGFGSVALLYTMRYWNTSAEEKKVVGRAV